MLFEFDHTDYFETERTPLYKNHKPVHFSLSFQRCTKAWVNAINSLFCFFLPNLPSTAQWRKEKSPKRLFTMGCSLASVRWQLLSH